jgi:hypothetical protein
MKQLKSIVILALITISTGYLFGGNDEPASKSAKVSISGSVQDKESREALPGVAIQLEGIDKQIYSDTDGNFSIEEITPGTYTMKVSCISYEEKTFSIEVGNAREVNVSVKLAPVEP